jgi:hypothetical protein
MQALEGLPNETDPTIEAFSNYLLQETFYTDSSLLRSIFNISGSRLEDRIFREI